MVRQMARERTSPRLLGICWGHQAVHHALGGNLAWLRDRPRVSEAKIRLSRFQVLDSYHGLIIAIQIGVHDVQLTTAGQQTFDTQVLVRSLSVLHKPRLLIEVQKMHKYHVCYVSELANNFTALAQSNDIALSDTGRILTFQGHPELSTYQISKALSERADKTYTPTKTSVDTGGHGQLHGISTSHDGKRIWAFIMKWAMAESST